jgi:peptide/nickel transport system permease protein
LVLFGVTFVLFLVSQIVPMDPIRLIVGDAVTPEVRAAISQKLGLDQPFIVQYFRYVERLLVGDLGESIRYSTPVKQLLLEAFPATLALIGVSAIVSIGIAFPLGFVSALYRDTWIDASARAVVMIGVATPKFYLSIILILVFGFYLGWLPISGRGDPPDFAHLVLPALALGLHNIGTSRLFRAALLDSLSEDYIRAARARGIAERTIVGKYAARNALIPAVTDMGLNIAQVGGTVILVETVFAYPGIGHLLAIGIKWNDFPLISGAITLLLTFVIFVNLGVDLLYRAIDPRMRTA